MVLDVWFKYGMLKQTFTEHNITKYEIIQNFTIHNMKSWNITTAHKEKQLTEESGQKVCKKKHPLYRSI